MTKQDIKEYFTYHNMSNEQRERSEYIRGAAHTLAMVILDNTCTGADQSAAIRKVREAVFTANSSIAMEY